MNQNNLCVVLDLAQDVEVDTTSIFLCLFSTFKFWLSLSVHFNGNVFTLYYI